MAGLVIQGFHLDEMAVGTDCPATSCKSSGLDAQSWQEFCFLAACLAASNLLRGGGRLAQIHGSACGLRFPRIGEVLDLVSVRFRQPSVP